MSKVSGESPERVTPWVKIALPTWPGLRTRTEAPNSVRSKTSDMKPSRDQLLQERVTVVSSKSHCPIKPDQNNVGNVHIKLNALGALRLCKAIEVLNNTLKHVWDSHYWMMMSNDNHVTISSNIILVFVTKSFPNSHLMTGVQEDVINHFMNFLMCSCTPVKERVYAAEQHTASAMSTYAPPTTRDNNSYWDAAFAFPHPYPHPNADAHATRAQTMHECTHVPTHTSTTSTTATTTNISTHTEIGWLASNNMILHLSHTFTFVECCRSTTFI